MAKTSRTELIVATWIRLDRPAVNGEVLATIQRAVVAESAPLSPAAIERALAEAGAELKHPDVIECDTTWRQAQFDVEARSLQAFPELMPSGSLTLKNAEPVIHRLEEARLALESSRDEEELQRLKAFVIEKRDAVEKRSRNRNLPVAVRREQGEILEWLRVWLQTPNLFADWISLRKQSPQFRAIFSGQTET